MFRTIVLSTTKKFITIKPVCPMKGRKGAREPFYFLSSSRAPLKKDIKNSISCAGVKNINIFGPRIFVKTIQSHSERMIYPIGWHTTFIPFTEAPALDFKGSINLAGRTQRVGARGSNSSEMSVAARRSSSLLNTLRLL